MEESRSKKTFWDYYLKTAIIFVLIVIVGFLVIIAIWSNATIPEKIYLFLIAVIFGLMSYIFKIKNK